MPSPPKRTPRLPALRIAIVDARTAIQFAAAAYQKRLHAAVHDLAEQLRRGSKLHRSLQHDMARALRTLTSDVSAIARALAHRVIVEQMLRAAARRIPKPHLSDPSWPQPAPRRTRLDDRVDALARAVDKIGPGAMADVPPSFARAVKRRYGSLSAAVRHARGVDEPDTVTEDRPQPTLDTIGLEFPTIASAPPTMLDAEDDDSDVN